MNIAIRYSTYILIFFSLTYTINTIAIPVINGTGDSFTVLLDYNSKDYFPVLEIDKDATIQVDPDIKTIILFPKGLEGASQGTQWPKSKNFPPTNQVPRFFLFRVLGSDDDINAYAGDYPKIEEEIKRGGGKALQSLRIIKIDTGNSTYTAYGLWKPS